MSETYQYAKGWNDAIDEMQDRMPPSVVLTETGNPTDITQLSWLARSLDAEFGTDLRDLLEVFVEQLMSGMGGNAIVGRYQTLGDIRTAWAVETEAVRVALKEITERCDRRRGDDLSMTVTWVQNRAHDALAELGP